MLAFGSSITFCPASWQRVSARCYAAAPCLVGPAWPMRVIMRVFVCTCVCLRMCGCCLHCVAAVMLGVSTSSTARCIAPLWSGVLTAVHAIVCLIYAPVGTSSCCCACANAVCQLAYCPQCVCLLQAGLRCCLPVCAFCVAAMPVCVVFGGCVFCVAQWWCGRKLICTDAAIRWRLVRSMPCASYAPCSVQVMHLGRVCVRCQHTATMH